MDFSFMAQLSDCINKIEKTNCHCVIIFSKAKGGFSSGLDLNTFYNAEDSEQTIQNIYNGVKTSYEIIKKIIMSSKVYIAALHGYVIGSAMSLALSCDLRIACDNTWFWLPDPQYGGLLSDGGSSLLCSIVGLARGKKLLMTNYRLNASEAFEWGLLYSIEEKRDLEEKVMSLGKKIAGLSGNSLSGIKKQANDGIVGDFKSEELLRFLAAKDFEKHLYKYFK